MRAPIDAAGRWLATLARVARDWTAFWYTPAQPNMLGVIRILTGLMLLYTHAVWGLALRDFFGATSWLSPSLVRAMERGQYVFSFWFWVPESALWPAYVVSMLILASFAAGLWTRVTSVLALAVAISYVNRVPAALFGLDQINIMLTLYLTIGPSGQAFSLDRWLAQRRGGKQNAAAPSMAANLALRLIQVHMCVIYFFAGISKLQGPSWWSGEAMWRAFANLEYQSLDMTWLAWHPWLVNLMSHLSVFWEIAFCALIWRPRWRPVMLAMAVVLHVGIGACLGMWTFGLIMLVGCMAFVPYEWIRACSQFGSGTSARTASSAQERRGGRGVEQSSPRTRRSGESLAHAADLRSPSV